MRRASRAIGYSLLGLLSAVVVEACSSGGGPRRPDAMGGRGGTSGLGNTDATTVDAPAEGGMAGSPLTEYDSLCGVTLPGGCVPDDVSACLATMGGQSGRGAGGASSGSAGTDGTSGVGGAGNVSGGGPQAGGAGEGGHGGEGGAGQAGGAPQGGESSSGRGGSSGTGAASGSAGTSGGSGLDAGVQRYSCQVGVRRSQPQASCAPAGPGGIDSPCLGGSDCQPGLGCVGKVAGRCRPYCCDHAACGSFMGTHCSAEPLLGVPASGGEARAAPVCVPAVQCSLAEEYPCRNDNACTCLEGTACMVVSDEGTTSCVAPGDGKVGEACPCSFGHVCSKATNECVKLCQTAAPGDDCGSGRCQATPALPIGWGVCVGFIPEDAG